MERGNDAVAVRAEMKKDMTSRAGVTPRVFAGALSIAMAGCVSQVELEMESEQAFQQMRTQIPVSNRAADRVYVNCVVRPILAQLEVPYASYDW